MKIEYLRALEDHTWDTVTVDVPDSWFEGTEQDQPEFEDAAQHYALSELHPLPEHRKVVQWSLYSLPDPDEQQRARYLATIEVDVECDLDTEDFTDRLSALLDHGTVRDSFAAAELDVLSLDLMKVE